MKRKTALALLAAALVLPVGAQENKEKPAAYPLNDCIVSDEQLGEMGTPVYLQYKGQSYGFCCKPCTKEFRENPEKFRRKLAKLVKERSN